MEKLRVGQDAHPEEGVESAVLHELCDDHDRAALGHHALQVDDVGVVELPHDARFSQEISPLLLCVAHLQGFDSHWKLAFSLQFQPSTADFSKFTFRENQKGSQYA